LTPSQQSPEALVGAQIDDYVIERVIGRGGMSVVYFARDVRAGKPAAIKVLQEGLPESMSADRRLEQEARAIARIDHPHVVRVFRFGWTPNALPYLSMEYLEGEALSQQIGRGRPMNTKRLLSIVDEMLGALSAAHALDIIHRDVKPDNVFLVRKDGREDFVKMVDFGIAKLRGNHPSRLVDTVRGVVLGTPEYLPPEIAMDEAVFPSTDLYAVGVILFEGLTGRLPFIGRGAGELAEQHCFTPPPRLRPFNRLIAAELEQVVLRCLNRFRCSTTMAPCSTRRTWT
jgi:serine/threonine-protein kinase